MTGPLTEEGEIRQYVTARTRGIAGLAALSLVVAGTATSARAVDSEAHQRTITLGLAGRIAFGQVRGTVNDSYRACSAEVPVTIQRFRAGSWRWASHHDDAKGRYLPCPRPRSQGTRTVLSQRRRALANGGTCAPRLANMCVGVRVAAGADLRAVTGRYGAGTTFCLAAGEYTVTPEVVLDPGDVHLRRRTDCHRDQRRRPSVRLLFDY